MLFYLSKEYYDFNDFRSVVKKELQCFGKCVFEFVVKVDNVVKVIDEFQVYSYCYNIKIVGVLEKGINEFVDEISGICVVLFREMGVDVLINDIDIVY